MNRLLSGALTLALAGASPALLAAPPADAEVDVNAAAEADAPAAGTYEEVDSITLLRRPYSFDVLDDDTLILWRTRGEPYLIELRWPSPDLKFARGIGVTSFGSRVHARGDAVQVRGLRYPIDKIYELDRDEAERLAEAS